MSGPTAGYSALKRFGEMLMRRSETDPRLARAAEQGYDLLNPVVHGTQNASVDKLVTEPRALYATSQPEHALQYTGGGRRGGTGSPTKGGVIVPMVLRGKPYVSELSVSDWLPVDDLSWLKQLGITDPEVFRKKVWDINVARQMARPNTQHYIDQGMAIDGLFGNSMSSGGDKPSSIRLHEALNAIEPGLVEEQPIVQFAHPYYDLTVSPKGRVMRSRNLLDGDAILIADPSIARSPWAEFLDEEVGNAGLMKKKGGLVQYKDCGCK